MGIKYPSDSFLGIGEWCLCGKSWPCNCDITWEQFDKEYKKISKKYWDANGERSKINKF